MSEPSSDDSPELNAHHIPLRALCGQFFHGFLSSDSSWSVKSFFVLTHYAFGSVRITCAFVFVPSTSTSGSIRRAPPPRGLPSRSSFLGCPLLRAVEGRRRRVRVVVDPLSFLLSCPSSFLSMPTRVVGTSSGAVGRMCRLCCSFSSAIVQATPSLLCVSTAVPRCTGADGWAFPSAIAFSFTFSRVKIFSILRYWETDRILRVLAAGGTKCLTTGCKGVVQFWCVVKPSSI